MRDITWGGVILSTQCDWRSQTELCDDHSTKKPVTTMLTYPWKCTVLHCNHLGNTWKPLVLMTQHFDYCPSDSECWVISTSGFQVFPRWLQCKTVHFQGQVSMVVTGFFAQWYDDRSAFSRGQWIRRGMCSPYPSAQKDANRKPASALNINSEYYIIWLIILYNSIVFGNHTQ